MKSPITKVFYMINSYKFLLSLLFILCLTSCFSQECENRILNENEQIILPLGQLVGGVDSVIGTFVETNNSDCAISIINQDNNQPWARYHLVLRILDYGLIPGDEIRIGIDGKNETGFGRIEVNQNNRTNSALISKNFTNEWSRVESTIIIPNVETLDIWLFSNYNRNTSGSVFYDNLVIEKIESFRPFVTTWKTDNQGVSQSNQITIPTFPGETYDYNVEWGDGSVSTHVSGDITHTYQVPGTYQVSISGVFPRIYFNSFVSNLAYKGKLLSIDQWGDIEWSSMANAFDGCINLNMAASDIPDLSKVTSLINMFLSCKSLEDNPSWNNWQTGNIIKMNGMFFFSNFNFNIANWDVSQVDSMQVMFANTPFNQFIGDWNVENLSSMNEMFRDTPFNQDISNWNVQNVESMQDVFSGSSFNQDISDWNVSMLKDSRGIFDNSSFSTSNYDLLLSVWSLRSDLQQNVLLGAVNINYCIGEEARQRLIDNYNWNISDAGKKCPIDFTNAFVTTWKTDNEGISNSNQITIPTNLYQTYNYTVDWGDGSITENITGTITHTYEVPGTYMVSLIGQFPQIYFDDFYDPINPYSDRSKIVVVNQWGNIQWKSMNRAFAGCNNLDITATDIPDFSFVTSMNGMFTGAKDLVLNATINDWDTSNITSMNQIFYVAEKFNQPIGNWDVSNVQDMSNMFSNAISFNQDISSWDTSKVVFMGSMFSEAKKFNQDIGNWDTGFVYFINNMFAGAEQFNQDIGDWNLENVTEMGGMFYNAKSFDQDISRWNVSQVTNLGTAFYYASEFNQDLSKWNISNVEYMYNMFDYSGLTTENYDAALIGWSQLPELKNDVSLSAIHTGFCEGEEGRQLLINTFNWTINDKGLARNCGAEEQIPFITTWKTNNPGISNDNQITIPTYTSQSWEEILEYDYTIDWGDGKSDLNVTGDITHTYDSPGIYTVSISGDFPRIYFDGWEIEKDNNKILTVEQWGNYGWASLQGAFYNCSNLNVLALDTPNLTWVESLSQMFYNCTSLEGNSSFNDWNTQNVNEMSGVFAYATQFNQPLYSWDVSNVRYFFDMFAGATSFDQPIGSWNLQNANGISGMFQNSNFNQYIGDWNVSNVEGMGNVFAYNPSFNQDISRWDVSKVEYMWSMFSNATSFNQDISNWNVQVVKDMSNMFTNASSFNQNLGSWNISVVSRLYSMIDNSGITLENYDKTLIGWFSLPSLVNGVVLGAIDKYFCESGQARAGLTALYEWTFLDAGKSSDCEVSETRPFITTWNLTGVDNPTNEIIIPTYNVEENGNFLNYDYNIDWGDGTIENNVKETISHIYSSPGEYKVLITGKFPRIYFAESGSNSKMLQSIDQWGDIEWSTMQDAFASCSNVDVLAKDVPNLSNVTDTSNMFLNCESLVGSSKFNKWNVSTLQKVDGMFEGTTLFNQILSNWDTSLITNMSAMFKDSGFKNSLGTWDVSQVTTMNQMFIGSQLTTINYDNTLVGWSRLPNLQSNIELDAGLSFFCFGEESKQRIIDTYNWSISDNGKECPEKNAFVTTWKTDNLGKTDNNQISLPIWSGPYRVDWGDGIIETDLYGERIHTYGKSGTYTVSIWGGVNSINFRSYIGNESNSDATKLMEINQWGDVVWSSADYAFSGCTNLDVLATDNPHLSNVSSLQNMFAQCSNLKGNESFNDWDMSNITNLSGMFIECENFNANISDWDVSNVTLMNYLFFNNLKFNQDISRWKVVKVTDMSSMFSNAINFNQLINSWNVSNAANMSHMFSGAKTFNQPLVNWNVSNVTNMLAMFQGSNFNQTIGGWDVSKVTNMTSMFGNVNNFNQDISGWDVSNVTEMNYMFGFTAFDQDLGSWNVSNVSKMVAMFESTALSIENYNKTLIGWSQLTSLQNSVELGASQYYCSSKDSRKYIIDTYSWVINDWGLDFNCDVIAPILVNFSPTGENVDIIEGVVLTATFNEPVQWQEDAAPIIIYDLTNNTVFATIDNTSERIVFADNKIEFALEDFSPSTEYELQIGAKSLEDSNENKFTGLVYGTWSFTTSAPVCNLAINEQPKDVVICQNATDLVFSVLANGTGALSYNWQTLGNGLTEWTTIVDQDGTETLLITTPVQLESNSLQYRVEITDNQGTATLEDDCTIISDAAILTVNQIPNVSFSAPEDLELNSGEQLGLGSGLPSGGVYSGLGVIDDGTGITYSFEPSIAGVGSHTITYTYINENGCSAISTDDIMVEQGVASCPDDLVNDDPAILVSSGTVVGGVDIVTGTTTDTNSSPCALVVTNNDASQPWGRYRISIRLSDYGIDAGDELFIGVDGKSLTGTGRVEINRNNAPNTALGSRSFGNSWSRYETTFTVPSGLTTLDLWFFSNYSQQAAGSAVYDNLVVRNLSATDNVAPIANAGTDISLEDSDGNGNENVTLDGRNSTDFDGTIIEYTWSENGSFIASGESATVSFARGVHNVTLTVIDDLGASSTDTVRITVTQSGNITCLDDLSNENPLIVLTSGMIVGGVDSSVGTSTDTNGSTCALVVGNIDSGQPWGRFRISIRLSDYGINSGDELFVGVDGKSLTGMARMEINRNNAPNTALGSNTFGNSWSRFETTLIVPSGITTIDLWFFSNYGQQTAGNAVYDNLEVINLSSGSSGKSIQEIKPLNDLIIYPNPANVETTISFAQPTTVGTIQIFDITGRLVRIIKGGLIDSQGTSVNVMEMPTGTYFIRTIDDFGVEFQQQMLIRRQ